MESSEIKAYEYLQLDENGVVIGVSSLSGFVDAEGMILLDTLSEELCAKVGLGWRLIDGEWLAPLPEPEIPQEPETDLKTEYELLNMALLLEIMDKLYTLEEGK